MGERVGAWVCEINTYIAAKEGPVGWLSETPWLWSCVLTRGRLVHDCRQSVRGGYWLAPLISGEGVASWGRARACMGMLQLL